MRYVFFGSPEFAAIILEKLLKSGFIPTAVVCNPDKPAGRKKIITPPPVKLLILEHKSWNIPILQPEKLDESFKFQVSNFMPDVFIVAAYAKIIKKEILDIPRIGTIGVHPSLLPKHRGSSPIQTAILNNDKKTGVTLYLMDEKMDNGPIIAQQKLEFPISIRQLADPFPKLLEELAELGGDLLVKTLPGFLAGKIKPKEQNHSQATYTKKFTTQDAFIEPDELEKAVNTGGETAVKIYNKIRALNPEPGTWTILTAEITPLIRANSSIKTKPGKRMKILEAELTSENKLKLKTIQFEGGKPLETAD